MAIRKAETVLNMLRTLLYQALLICERAEEQIRLSGRMMIRLSSSWPPPEGYRQGAEAEVQVSPDLYPAKARPVLTLRGQAPDQDSKRAVPLS